MKKLEDYHGYPFEEDQNRQHENKNLHNPDEAKPAKPLKQISGPKAKSRRFVPEDTEKKF